MAKKKKNEVTVTLEEQVENAKAKVTNELEAAKSNDYSSVVIVGTREDGSIALQTTVGSLEFMQYLFARSSFELFIKQREIEARQLQEKAAANG